MIRAGRRPDDPGSSDGRSGRPAERPFHFRHAHQRAAAEEGKPAGGREDGQFDGTRGPTVAEIDGVLYVDDSKGTNVGATVAALAGLGGMRRVSDSGEATESANALSPGKIVVILGGDGKGQDFSPLAPAVARYARAVVLIGRDGPAIGSAIAGAGVPVESASDMADAVRRAARLAHQGDAALLSPACASFDMFRNYEHRADEFVAAVKALPC